MTKGHVPAPVELPPPARPRPEDLEAAAKPRSGPSWFPLALPTHLQRGPWWVLSATLAGLVLAIVVAGLVGLAFNRTVNATTEDALRYDVALQDDADDLRVHILDLRHAQRNIMFYGPDNDRSIAFENAYTELLDEIQEIAGMGIREPSLPQPEQLRQMTEDYHATFAPVIDLFESDRTAFDAAANAGLMRLSALEREARKIDVHAEQHADIALAKVEKASANARLVLLLVIGGLVLIGAALVYGAIRVIEEIRRLYEAEQAASKRLSQALQAKSDFIADASHELRTPLTVMRGNAEAGLALEAEGPQREILEEIVEEAASMTRLVEDLLFLARSDAASPQLVLAQVAVEPLLQGVAARAEVLVQRSGAVLSTALTVQDAIVADAMRIEQAIMVLIDNAAKYSPPGARVRLSSSSWKGELIVEVADEGPGIPEEELELVFERFYRTDAARNRRRGGAGLGLPIARTIVEAHGGRIEAHSQVGKGTRMRLHLPLAGVSTPALPAPAMATPELAMGKVSV